MASILTRIQDLIPAVGETTVNHTRAGLRPGIVDHVPALGPLPGVDNVTFAVGHDRSGILLTPITAKMIASSILDGAADFGAFAASRFAEAAP